MTNFHGTYSQVTGLWTVTDPSSFQWVFQLGNLLLACHRCVSLESEVWNIEVKATYLSFRPNLLWPTGT